jgi:hypothetical protein
MWVRLVTHSPNWALLYVLARLRFEVAYMGCKFNEILRFAKYFVKVFLPFLGIGFVIFIRWLFLPFGDNLIAVYYILGRFNVFAFNVPYLYVVVPEFGVISGEIAIFRFYY